MPATRDTEGTYELKQVDVRLMLKEGSPLYSTQKLNNPSDAVEVLKNEFVDYDREVIAIVNLDSQNRPLNFSIVSAGTVSQTQFRVADLFKSSILSNAAKIFMAHNHPSGLCQPSKADHISTKRIIEAGKLLDIPLLDHVIIGAYRGESYSFRENCPQYFEDSSTLIADRKIIYDTGIKSDRQKVSFSRYMAEAKDMSNKLRQKSSETNRQMENSTE